MRTVSLTNFLFLFGNYHFWWFISLKYESVNHTNHTIYSMTYDNLKIISSTNKKKTIFINVTGYAHSFLNPILYWILNHNTLRQSSSCAPFLRLAAVQRFIRIRLRVPTAPPPPSSTNEAALGPFNPRYIKARPQQYRPPASSMNLY